MANTNEKSINWHFEILPKETKKALDFLSEQEWIKDSGWYLAGGTAFALQTGHRSSVDLDFFIPQKTFESEKFLRNFFGNPDWKTNTSEDGTVYGELFGAKVSFIAYPFFKTNGNFLRLENIDILSVADVAVMKIVAISQRGKKRDFVDLYWYAKNIESLENVLARLRKQYPDIVHDFHHILKSLVYFSDAENDPMPKINFKADWKEMKTFFVKEIRILAEKIL